MIIDGCSLDSSLHTKPAGGGASNPDGGRKNDSEWPGAGGVFSMVYQNQSLPSTHPFYLEMNIYYALHSALKTSKKNSDQVKRRKNLKKNIDFSL